MTKYKLLVKEILYSHYTVEAENEEEAKKKFIDDSVDICFEEMVGDKGSEDVEEVKVMEEEEEK